MVAGSRHCKNFTITVGTEDLTGKAKSAVRTNLTMQVQEYRPAGREAPIKVPTGYEILEFEITLFDINPEVLSMINTRQTIILREYVQSDDGSQHTYYHEGFGLVYGEDKGTVENGQGLGEYKFMINLERYTEIFDQKIIKELNIPRTQTVVGLIDQAQNIRRILNVGDQT
ncbi:phage major tail tube protein [Cognatishimia sp.]|uniref:phage major tail tube protein n=1 Tax=Cognatishimia sp. TaxID=2211648 RepID=UPI003517FB60|nr:phage major tail tube protein [Cognatishimia sp.]